MTSQMGEYRIVFELLVLDLLLERYIRYIIVVNSQILVYNFFLWSLSSLGFWRKYRYQKNIVFARINFLSRCSPVVSAHTIALSGRLSSSLMSTRTTIKYSGWRREAMRSQWLEWGEHFIGTFGQKSREWGRWSIGKKKLQSVTCLQQKRLRRDR